MGSAAMCRFRMPGLASLRIRMELRCLATIEHAVVTHDPYPAMPQTLDSAGFHRRPLARGPCILPRHQQRQLARVVDAGEQIVLDDAVAGQVEAERRKQIVVRAE